MRKSPLPCLLLLATLCALAATVGSAAAKQPQPPYGSTYAGSAETTLTHCPRVDDVKVTLAPDGHLLAVTGFKAIGQEAWFGRVIKTSQGISLQAYGYTKYDPDPNTPGATLTLGFTGERATGFLSFMGPLRLRCRFLVDLQLDRP